MAPKQALPGSKRKKPAHPFRSAVFRGLGVVLPPLITVLIFIWVGSTVNQYMLKPVNAAMCEMLVSATAEIRTDLTPDDNVGRIATDQGREYYLLNEEEYIPLPVFNTVNNVYRQQREEPMPHTGLGVYRSYVEHRFLRPYYVIPFLLCIFMLILYLLGKFMAAGIGRFFLGLFEGGVNRVPLVRSVYSGVKQVSDFMFREQEFSFNRVVAVEYPRKGMWSLGFVTGESFADLHTAAREPVLAVFIPCSPLPLTGFTVNCVRSECIDLNMTFDQACQFLISCGVIVPPQQLTHLARQPAAILPGAKPADAAPS
jgi:uncharacterized membrane protein